MNVLILSSSNEEIDSYYKSVARSISSCLAKNEFDLVFGACSKSMMGICYEEFAKNNRNIYAYTTEKYKEDLNNLQNAEWFVCDNTFEMKNKMFENADLIVALPGGIGTASEILSYIEECRSNDKNIPIEIYDENNFYKNLFQHIESMREMKFVDDSIYNYFDLSHNKEEFIDHLNKTIYKRRSI